MLLPRALSAALIVALLSFVAVVAGAYVFLPLLLETIVAQSLQDQLGLNDAPEVELTSGSALDTLSGNFDGGRVILKNPELGGVRPDEVTVELDPLAIDMLGSLTSGRVRGEGPVSGAFRAEIPEGEVARIFTSSAVVPVKGVELEEGYLVVGSEVEVLGGGVPVGAEGELVLWGDELRFEPRRIEAFGVPVPERLARELLRGTEFVYPIGQLPFEGGVSGVETREGRLVLSGELEGLPLG